MNIMESQESEFQVLGCMFLAVELASSVDPEVVIISKAFSDNGESDVFIVFGHQDQAFLAHFNNVLEYLGFFERSC